MLRVTKTKRAGLIMSVARIERNLRKGRYAKRISTGAAVYLAGTIEYVCAEILDLAANECLQDKKKLIKERHLMLAIKNDHELKELLKDVTIPNAGAMPFIHPGLLPNSSAKNKPSDGV